LGSNFHQNDGGFSSDIMSALQGAGLSDDDINGIIDDIESHGSGGDNFDAMQDYAKGAAQGFLEKLGLTDFQDSLSVIIDFDDVAETDSFTISADSYNYDGDTVSSGFNMTVVFQEGQIIDSTGLIEGIDGLDIAGLEQWYEYSDPEKNDYYARMAAEELFKQVGIDHYTNVHAEVQPTETGNQITIEADTIDYEGEIYYALNITLAFVDGELTDASGIPSGLDSLLNESSINTWYEYSGPNQQRQNEQQDGGYFDGDDTHQQSYSNVWTWTDEQGITWTVVDKDVDGVWSSTQTGSNGDVRTHSSSWNHQTQTNTFTEIFVSAERGINTTMVEVSSPNGVTKTYSGAADGIGWMPLHELYSDLDVIETLDQYWNTENITGTGVNSYGDTVIFSYDDHQLLIDGESVQADFGFDDFFDEQGTNEYEWVDEWSNTIWAVVEENVDGVWTMTETAWSMNENGEKDGLTGDSRVGFNSWDESTKTNTWTMHEVSAERGFDFTRVETWSEETGLSSETITGTFDQIGWYFLGDTYDNIDATVERDANWSITSITGTVQDPDDDSATLAVTFENNEVFIDGKSVNDRQDDKPHFQEGEANEWTWTDWDGTEWAVKDEEIDGVWTSIETNTGTGDVRSHTSEWDNATNTSTATESFVSGDGKLDFSRSEIWNEDGSWSETISGTTNQLGWMWLDGTYNDVNVTIDHGWDGMTLTGSGFNVGGDEVEFTINEHEELLIDGAFVDLGDNADFNMNEIQSWESSWEWADWDGTVWVVTDTQEGETWTSTEVQYTDDTKDTATGAERTHSSKWNERTQTNIWTDAEKSADGNNDFTRVETQLADGTSTEKITGKTNKFGDYENVEIIISRDSNWNVTDISGTVDTLTDTLTVTSDDSGNILIDGVAVDAFKSDGGHANMESSESSWTWTDWDGVTWTVTDKQEGDTWTSTEAGSNGDVRVHKNTWSGDTETWTDSFTSYDGHIDVTRVEVRNSNDNTSKTTITGKDGHIGWWDFDQPYTGLEVVISRDSDWNIVDVTGTADGDTVFGFENGELTINGDAFHSGGDDRSNLMQEAWVNTWEWQDGNGVTWTVTDKQDGDTWTSTEEGSNGDVRINSSAWDSEINDYVQTTSFKSGGDDRDFSIRETRNEDGSSSELIKGSTDEINWTYLGEIYIDVDVTIMRDSNWEVISITGSGTNSNGDSADFGWDTANYQLTFDNAPIQQDAGYGGGGQVQESWESSWEWTDWDGTIWTVTESQVGDVWTSAEVGSNGAERVFKSSWDSVKQISVWSESYDEDASSTEDGGLDYTRVETYNPNGTSSETITGSTDNIAWYPLHGLYTDVSVTIERDADWNVYKVSGSGTNSDGYTADFGWSEDGQLTFDGGYVENPEQYWVEDNQYWENTSSWEDWDGTIWEVVEIQDGSTWTRTETNEQRGDFRKESSVWDHDTQQNTWTMHESNSDRNIDVTEVAIWDSASETETKIIQGFTDHIDWMPLNGTQEVDVTITFDNTHTVIDASGTVTIDGQEQAFSYENGQYLFDGDVITVQWTDWDETVWEMSQTQDGETMTRTEAAVSGPREGAERIETHSWNHEEQKQTRTERFTNENDEIITDVTSTQSFNEDGSLEVLTGSTNHIDWMQLGEIYTNVNITIQRDNDWNIQSIEGFGTNAAEESVEIGFSANENQLVIGGELVAADIGHTSENTWEWQDGEGVNWTVVDKQSGNTWTSTETGDNGDVRIFESTWDDTNQTNTWSESYTNADKSIDFVKTEIYDENLGTSTMTTAGASDHIGWMYIGEIYTNMNVVETRDENWNTVDLSGTATNSEGDTVSFGWDGGITIDGDALSTHGPEDFSMSSDNYQNEWSYSDHNGIEWTVVESQQGDVWVSEETSEFGDIRVNSNYWDDDAQESTFVSKFKSADGVIKFKMSETWSNDGSSTMSIQGDTDHIGWDYAGQIFSDIDVVISRDSEWNITSVESSGGGIATARNEKDEEVEISFDDNNDITIDGVSIYRLGDNFYNDFDQDMLDQLDQIQTGSWEFEYTNEHGSLIKVVEEVVVTDIVSIKTNDLDITLVFDLGDGDYESPGVAVLSSKGIPEGLDGFNYSSLEAWYSSDVMDEMDEGGHNEEAELIVLQDAIEEYLSVNSHSVENLAVDFAISDSFITKEENQDNGNIYLRTRTENLGSETEREENFVNQADLENNNPQWWAERVRTYEDSEYGFREIMVETSSSGKDLQIVTNYAPDGTVSIVATGTEVMGEGDHLFVMTDIFVTSVLEDGWKYSDFYGTGVIEGGPMDGMQAVITSDGTDPNGGPMIHITVDVGSGNASDGGQFEHMYMYSAEGMREAQLHDMGNPLDRYMTFEGEGFASSKNSIWDQTSFASEFNSETNEETVVFEGEFVRENKPNQTITVTEVRRYDEGGMLEEIEQEILSTRGNGGESYTRVFTLNERFDVEIEMVGAKVIRGEAYNNIDMHTEITQNGDVRIEGTGTKLDGTNVDFFKGHQDQSMEIVSINRDGSIHKVSEDGHDDADVEQRGPVNEIQQWQYTDHEGTLWTVIDKFDGQTMSSKETTAAGDSRTIKNTWADDGSYSFELTEAMIGEAVFAETRSGAPGFSDGRYQEVESVLITEDGVTLESYTQTMVFNEDYSATRSLEGQLEFMGEIYTNAAVVIEQDQNWQATSVSGTATNSNGEEAIISMDGIHPWGDPKLVFTVEGQEAIIDTREVIGNKSADNIDPLASEDYVVINENQAAVIDVIANDSDADDDPLSIKSIGEASCGEVNLASGSVIYTPGYGYSGDDSFTYTVTDGKGGTSQGTVSITVTGVNAPAVAVDDTYTFKQGSGSVVLDVLANDIDEDGDDLSILSIDPSYPPHTTDEGGIFSVFAGVVSFDLPGDDFVGVQQVTYYVTDGSKNENGHFIFDEGLATITIEALNNAPDAVADTISLEEDEAAVLMNVLSNDTDADGDALSIDSYTNPSYGTLRLMGGSLFYTPDENYTGEDSFTYSVVDPLGGSATETVTLAVTEVNDAPVTIGDVLNVEEGSADGITVNLLSNDYDRESDAFTLTSIGAASHGAAVINEDGTVTYTPGQAGDGSNYAGHDEFAYEVTDENGAKATGTVSITVSVVNGAPVTIADVSSVAEDSSSNRISVLNNDSDPENNTLTLDSVSVASYGDVDIAGNVVLYSPDDDFSGEDSFSYWVTDGEGGSTRGEVTVTVTGSNDAPTAVNDALGTVSSTRPTTLDLLANDFDVDGDSLTITDVGDATYGNVTISGDSVRFNADRGAGGNSDSFTYTISDSDGETSTATANFTISSNANPNAINDKPADIEEDASAIEIDVLSNDTDSDGDSVTVLSINTEAEHGAAVLQNGKIFYAPTANYNGLDSFTYMVKDGNGGLDEATVSITVSSVNDAPITVNDTLTVDAGSSDNAVIVLDNDSDVDSEDSLSVVEITEALHGTVTLTSGALTYTPDADYDGSDSFTYQVSDGTTQSTGTVNITVSPGNTLPTVVSDSASIAEDSKNQLVDVLANDSDDDGNTLSVASVTQGENGSVQLTGGSVFYTPDANFAGTDVFTYTATDGNGGISSARVTMIVTGEEDAPTAVNDTLDTVEAGSGKIEIDLISNDSDADGDSISITSVSDALYGTVTYTAGSIYYQPGTSVQADAFSYTLEDENGNESTGYASIDVIAANNLPTGALTISGGTQPYQTLSVSNTMADADGISGDFSYQWYADGTEISGQTGDSYTVTLEDVDTEFSVTASYTDDLGNAESKTSDTTNAVSQLDHPFYFEASEVAEDGTLTLTLKVDVEAIYSRSDITGLTGADLNLDIDWDKFATLEGVDTKYSMTTIASDLILLESSSTSATDSFDTITLASLRLSDPLLTLVDTDEGSVNVGSSDDLITVIIKPLDPSEKVSISLSGMIEANQGQVSFNQYDATMNNITGVQGNTAPEGLVTTSGEVVVDGVLTASHSITDEDGMQAVSYQWLRDGDAIIDATDATYKIVTADINAALSVRATYTDGGGTDEMVTSSSTTVTQSSTNKPFMFVSELMTASEASEELYDADYALDPTETIIKLTLNGDISRFDDSNSGLYESIAGAEIDVSLDWTQFEDIEYIGGFSSTFEISNVFSGGQLFMGTITNDDNEFSKILLSSLNISSEPVLTLLDTESDTDPLEEIDFVTVYLNPLDSVKDIEITFNGDVSVNQGEDTFGQLSHSLEVAAKTYDAIVSTGSTDTTITVLDNVSANLWSGGVDTGTSIALESGEASFDETVSFDVIKLSATDAYDFDIGIGDAIDVLRHIVDLEAIAEGSDAFHAADTDNNDTLNISDAIDILRHIVDLEAIDTFDLIDSEGNRVTELDANASGEAPTWTIVANGDVDMSGSFDDDYIVTSDIV